MFTDHLYTMQHGIESRWATYENPTGEKGMGGRARGGRKGSAWFTLENGDEAVLADVQGRSGILRRMWMTINIRNKATLRGIILEIYWDGVDSPAVHAPIGDFFCHGIGRMAVVKNALFSSPEGRSFNCFIPMPFRKGMRIVVKNRSGQQVKHFYYEINYTLDDETGDSMYFHCWFNRENPTSMRRDFELLPYLKGSGRYLGVNLGIRCDKTKYFDAWWGEGEVKIYLDGDGEYPTLCSTGVEDYVATAWGMDYYYDFYYGGHIFDKENMEIACYRFHIPDPVFFHKDVRITIQQIGAIDTDDELHKARFYFNEVTKGYQYISVNGNKIDFPSIDGNNVMPELFEREDDWSCCTYFYYEKPENSLPVLPLEKYFI